MPADLASWVKRRGSEHVIRSVCHDSLAEGPRFRARALADARCPESRGCTPSPSGKTAKAASWSLIDIGGVVVSFEYLVATGLTLQVVSADRAPADTMACFRRAVAATMVPLRCCGSFGERRSRMSNAIPCVGANDAPNAVEAATQARKESVVGRCSGVQ